MKRARKHFKESSPTSITGTALESNIVQAISSQKKKKAWDTSKVTCYSSYKKGFYAKDCIKIKN